MQNSNLKNYQPVPSERAFDPNATVDLGLCHSCDQSATELTEDLIPLCAECYADCAADTACISVAEETRDEFDEPSRSEVWSIVGLVIVLVLLVGLFLFGVHYVASVAL